MNCLSRLVDHSNVLQVIGHRAVNMQCPKHNGKVLNIMGCNARVAQVIQRALSASLSVCMVAQPYRELPVPFEAETEHLRQLCGISAMRIEEARRRWFQV